MAATLAATDLDVVGYVAPPGIDLRGRAGVRRSDGPATRAGRDTDRGPDPVTDGGVQAAGRAPPVEHLGGLSRLDDLLLAHDVDAVLLAFGESDRAAFFGTLTTCYDHGLVAKVHGGFADSVLLDRTAATGDVVDVALDPWDLQDRVAKRVFDVCFALAGLVALSPLLLAAAVAIKLDSTGPVLYSQERTAEFGDTFTVYKFRSMVPEAEAGTGARLSEEDAGGVDPRVTRVGRVLRRTHLDEIPQLWSILAGDMSVVGPRPERPALDSDIESSVAQWRRRWFVKPGLTGLAQIRGATGHDPAEKLRYDVEYVRRQSFPLDLKIVIRQVWQVLGDVAGAVRS
jgi:lipopolysaccharide/colanic/teichoic acid biosynthesis glycosyltransferase